MSIQKYRSHHGEKANQQRAPNHVAIIMDGNGRWATQRNLSRTKGHRKGVESAWEAVSYCLENKIPVLTLFAFGQENWKRPSQEVRNLFRIFYLLLKRDMGRLLEHNVKLRIIGDRTPFAPYLRNTIQESEALTQNNTALTLNIAINYSGKWDILQAMQKLVEKHQGLHALDVLEKQFEAYLSFQGQPEPDLFIRTSGVQRLSNFMLWDLAYSEIFFTKALWPDFDKNEFDNAVSFFNQCERRFGLISEQVSVCSNIES
ncbi:polyprenyl diphosphate synthase [Candidatus Berkiella cookevillensis]|uniref:Ditrans,polycis-undecaprenyl-diphosphate synthase ((2E,6E)-farnesyl-diphosphate specific) n=2 Tax=Candidatus Berkiella cookevillensis TaxID=437022 RepID=A0A0Q9YHL9_9GAMM|nr:polyprenyl diphosphate synthase [Candidatus Berkiella cookevillensis]